MELILTEDIPKLGNAGDVVKVKDGFGRNYLLPQKKAMVANSKNLKALESQKKSLEAKRQSVRQNAEEVALKLKAIEVTVQKDAGAGDRLFGSVTKMDIAAALHQQGVQIDKHLIELATPIKAIGTYDVSVKLHPEISTTLKVWVVRKT